MIKNTLHYLIWSRKKAELITWERTPPEALIGFDLTICYKERKVSGFGVQVSAIKNLKWFGKLTTKPPSGGSNNWFLTLFEIWIL